MINISSRGGSLRGEMAQYCDGGTPWRISGEALKHCKKSVFEHKNGDNSIFSERYLKLCEGSRFLKVLSSVLEGVELGFSRF